jgi:hypothetical protein
VTFVVVKAATCLAGRLAAYGLVCHFTNIADLMQVRPTGDLQCVPYVILKSRTEVGKSGQTMSQ